MSKVGILLVFLSLIIPKDVVTETLSTLPSPPYSFPQLLIIPSLGPTTLSSYPLTSLLPFPLLIPVIGVMWKLLLSLLDSPFGMKGEVEDVMSLLRGPKEGPLVTQDGVGRG